MTGGRYHRQIPLIGAEGQERLADATVSIIGAGGLGSPVSTYLALAGVGELIIIDDDEISPSNLNRQFLHASADIGKKKAWTYVGWVTLFSTVSGLIYGAWVDGAGVFWLGGGLAVFILLTASGLYWLNRRDQAAAIVGPGNS